MINFIIASDTEDAQEDELHFYLILSSIMGSA